MTATPRPDQPTAAKAVNDDVMAEAVAPRRPEPTHVSPPQGGGFGRFLFNTMFLALVVIVAFGAGWVYTNEQVSLDQAIVLEHQASAQERIAALEEEIRQLADARANANSVELDLTEVFAPIRTAVKQLAEAQLEVIARQISAEVAEMVESNVQSVDTSTAAAPLASARAVESAGAKPWVADIPRDVTPAAEPPAAPDTPATHEAPRPEPAPGPSPDELPTETDIPTESDDFNGITPAASEIAPADVDEKAQLEAAGDEQTSLAAPPPSLVVAPQSAPLSSRALGSVSAEEPVSTTSALTPPAQTRLLASTGRVAESSIGQPTEHVEAGPVAPLVSGADVLEISERPPDRGATASPPAGPPVAPPNPVADGSIGR